MREKTMECLIARLAGLNFLAHHWEYGLAADLIFQNQFELFARQDWAPCYGRFFS